ncbi:MAG: DNA-binding HxlR family transcriptional regulator [Bacteroidia bacterium]
MILKRQMEKKFRSTCIIASALDLIGDKWSLLIIRDMLLNKKKTFKEMAASDEGVATNLLSSRLKMLESFEVITKRKLPENKKENIYLLTPKGIDLAPLILEIVLWSDQYVRPYNTPMNAFEGQHLDKPVVIAAVQEEYRTLVRHVLG